MMSGFVLKCNLAEPNFFQELTIISAEPIGLPVKKPTIELPIPGVPLVPLPMPAVIPGVSYN